MKKLFVMALCLILLTPILSNADDLGEQFVDYLISNSEDVILPIAKKISAVDVNFNHTSEGKGTIVLDYDKSVISLTGTTQQRNYTCESEDALSLFLCFYCGCIDGANLAKSIELYIIDEGERALVTEEEIRFCSEEFQNMLLELMEN